MRQAAGDGAENGDSMLRPMKDGACCDCSSDGKERAGQLGSKAAKKEDADYDCARNGNGVAVSLRQRAKYFVELQRSAASVYCDAEHFTEHGDADLKADSGKKADENSLREKVREETKLERASNQKEDAGQQSHHARKFNVTRAADLSHSGETACKNRSGSRIGSDHEIARRSKDGKSDQREQKRVKPGDDRHAGDCRVAKRLRDVHGCERESGEEIFR